MSKQTLKFGENKINKSEFHDSKQEIALDLVDVNKIVTSDKVKIYDISSKSFIGYSDEDTIKPLCIVLSQMNGYIKYFKNNNKNMSFISEDEDI